MIISEMNNLENGMKSLKKFQEEQQSENDNLKHAVSQTIDEVLQEIEERSARSYNVIFFGLIEKQNRTMTTKRITAKPL